jgi:hypothetical protein
MKNCYSCDRNLLPDVFKTVQMVFCVVAPCSSQLWQYDKVSEEHNSPIFRAYFSHDGGSMFLQNAGRSPGGGSMMFCQNVSIQPKYYAAQEPGNQSYSHRREKLKSCIFDKSENAHTA